MTRIRKYVQIHLPKTPTICSHVHLVKTMWASLVIELLYTGILAHPQSDSSTSAQVGETDEYVKLSIRFIPSSHIHKTRKGGSLISSVVANVIENSSPKELGKLLMYGIEQIGLENIQAYAPRAFSRADTAKGTDSKAWHDQMPDQHTSNNLKPFGPGRSTGSCVPRERGFKQIETPGETKTPIETKQSADDRSHPPECDTHTSRQPEAYLRLEAEDFMSRFKSHDEIQPPATQPIDGTPEAVSNYPVKSNNVSDSSGIIGTNEVSSDVTVPSNPADSALVEREHLESASRGAAAVRISDAEIEDKRSRYAKYAKF